MSLRQIRTNAKNLIDNTTDAAEGLGAGYGRLVKRATESWCDLYSKAPNFIFDSPAGGFAQGALNQICENREGFQPPDAVYDEENEANLPFNGGQCEGDYYEIRLQGTETDCFSGNTSSFDALNNVYGPIEAVQLVADPRDDDRFRVIFRVEGYDVGGSPDADGTVINAFSGGLKRGGCGEGTAGESYDNLEVTVTNLSNSADNCGEPPPPPPPEQWDDPDSDPPEVNVDIDIDYPDNYVNFPPQTVNITFNEENKTYEGDRFEIRLEGSDTIFEYDDSDPPSIIPGGLPQGIPKLPGVGDLIPEGLGDRFRSIPGFLREQFDKIDNFIPTPIPGVSVGDIIDGIENLRDLLGEDEDSEPIDQVTVPYYDCETEEFSSYTWEVVRSSWNSDQVETLQETANNAKLWCDEPNLLIGYPDWWAIRAGANRPQLVQIFRRNSTRTYHSLVIPHYAVEPEPETAIISEYEAGNVMGRETLTDNSKLTVYAIDEQEALRVLDEMASWVRPEMRYDPPRRTLQNRQGETVAQSTRIPRIVEVWENGRENGSAPHKAWKCPPFNEPTP